jgi:spermidine/putrescine transport system ATP-binding protein
MEPLLSFKGVTKGFDDVTILNKMDLEIESGHFAGKSPIDLFK